MIGLKPIDEMSLKECYAFLEKETIESCGDYGMVKTRYERLVEETKLQEEKDYNSCKSVADYSAFISQYGEMSPAYEPRLLDDARKKKTVLENMDKQSELERQRRERQLAEERRLKKKRVLLIVLSSIIAVGILVFFIGYRPARSLSVENVDFGKEGGEKIIRIETNASADAIELTKPEKDWVKVMLEGKKLNVSVEANPDPDRSCTMVIRAYSTFFGERIGTPCEEEVYIHQNSGYAINTLDVSSHSFSIDKYGDSKQVNIKTDGVALQVAPTEKSSSWISVNSKSQNHNEQFYHIDDFEINVEKNPGGERTGKVIVSTGGLPSQEIIISQASGLASKKISASPLRIHCNDADGLTDGSYYKVDFSTDGTSWSKSEPDWIEVEEVIGVTGEGYLKVIPTYNDGSYRDGTIYLRSNNGHTTEIEVSQDGGPSNLYASLSTWRSGTGYDSKTISVNNDSHYPLSVSSSDTDWLTASVSGNNVTVNCKSTKSGYKSPRKGTVTVKCRNATCSIVVKQDGYKDCDKCGGNGKCKGGNAFGQHSWQVYGAVGQHWEPYSYGISGGYWVTDYGYSWQYCSQCGGSGKCSKCNGIGKIECSY